MSYTRTPHGGRGRVTELYAREARRTMNGYHRVGEVAPVSPVGPRLTRMVSRVSSGSRVAPSTSVATSKSGTSTSASAVPTRPGYTWVPPSGGIAGHWVRKAAATRPVVSVEETSTDPEGDWCRANGFITNFDLGVCRNIRALPDGKNWTPEAIRKNIQWHLDQQTVRDQRGGGAGGGTVASPPPGYGGGAAPGYGGGGGGGGGGGRGTQAWGGGAALPGAMAPEPGQDRSGMPGYRKPFPTTLAVAGIAGGATLLYFLLKRKK